jgi:NAD(P)-dependent dehydrogenase (short-subunit alcohol dehydrogenase family)
MLTGAAGLLGRHYVRALCEAGARVALVDIDRDGVVDAARDAGPTQTLALPIDVTDQEAVRRGVDETLRRFGRVDVLVNNAAIDPKVDGSARPDQAAFEDFPLAVWNHALAVNVTGMFLCTQAVVRPMLSQGSGVIVNVSSIYGMVGPDQRLYEEAGAQPVFKPVTYSVSKSAVYGLTKYLAAYWAGRNIRVNALTLGGVEHRQPAAFRARYAARTPMGRMARPNECCGPLLFLASDDSSYMTGANLVVDGGWTAW